MRLTGLTWNRATAFSDGLVEDSGGGTSPLGRRLLAEMEECGIALDLAHLPRRATEQALELFGGEVLCSHGNAHAVWANGRNNADDVLDALAARDGVSAWRAQRVFVGPGEAAEQLAARRDGIASRRGPPAWPRSSRDYLPEGAPEPPRTWASRRTATARSTSWARSTAARSTARSTRSCAARTATPAAAR